MTKSEVKSYFERELDLIKEDGLKVVKERDWYKKQHKLALKEITILTQKLNEIHSETTH